MKITVKNGIIVTPEGSFPLDLLIGDDKVAALGERGDFPGSDREIDAAGCYVMPGAIDTHTHIEEPFMGAVPEETWPMATRNAAMGGVTTVLNFVNQEPDKTLVASIVSERERISPQACIDFGFHGVFSDYTDLDAIGAEFAPLFAEGVTSVKTFTIYSDSGFFADDWTIYNLMRSIREQGGVLGVHAENMPIGEKMQEEFIRQGKTESVYWPQIKPNFVEAEAVRRVCSIAEQVGCGLYIAHTSTRESVDIIAEYRAKGLPIFGEGCSHYFMFNDEIYSKPLVGWREIISPPLRSPADQEALWRGVRNGQIVLFGSDHCPYNTAAKDAGYKAQGFPGVVNGGPGILENVPALFAEGVVKGRITPERFVEVTSANPAKLFGLWPRKGALAPGSDADIVIFDPAKKQTLGAHLYEGIDWSVYEGMELTGYPVLTMLRGRVIVENGKFLGESGAGEFIPGKMDPKALGTVR